MRQPLQYESPATPERGAWEFVRDGWQQVYGSFDRLGVSVERHDFIPTSPLDWGRSFHDDSVEVCLNLTGHGKVSLGNDRVVLAANTAGIYASAGEPLSASRGAGARHHFITVEFSCDFLARHLAGAEDAVEPVVRRAVFDQRRSSSVGSVRHLQSAQQTLSRDLAQPPVPPAALSLWYQSKVLEVAATFLVTPDPEMFCTRQKRLARERTERVQAILKARLADPPGLEDLGREVGVSPFYLSRIFSQETGMTIPQYLRRIRMERAAELLRDGRHNVTEAAFAVGYSSLGHFSKSFCEVIGCCPMLYPQALGLLKQ